MEKRKGCKILLVAFITLIIRGVPMALAASDYPNRPIEIIIPNEPGAAMDFVNTLFKTKVEKIIGQPMILVFKPGAMGMIGTSYTNGSKPDGYTLMAATPSTLLLPMLTNKEVKYTLNDFVPICNLTVIPTCYVVNDNSPYKTMQEFIQAAKTKKMKYATYGAFSTAHIAMEALGKAAGFQATHIPYKGAAAAMTAAMGGHVDMAIANNSSFVGPGKLRMLVNDLEKRSENHPDVPTLKELGYPAPSQVYYSLWGPKGIPKDIVNKIYEAYKKAIEANRDELTKATKGQDHTIVFSGGEELGKIYKDQIDYYKKMLKQIE
jgi:tripartite-type tricarboxylate transporter receptor subunit TctC